MPCAAVLEIAGVEQIWPAEMTGGNEIRCEKRPGFGFLFVFVVPWSRGDEINGCFDFVVNGFDNDAIFKIDSTSSLCSFTFFFFLVSDKNTIDLDLNDIWWEAMLAHFEKARGANGQTTRDQISFFSLQVQLEGVTSTYETGFGELFQVFA